MTEREQYYQEFLEARGVETPCKKCNGLGVRLYGSTSTWRGGIGGAAMTEGVCDHCWGSGDENKKWTNLRKVAEAFQLISKIKGVLSALDCGDSGCFYAKDKSGQRTQGGCNCFRFLPPKLNKLGTIFQQIFQFKFGEKE